MLTNMWGNMPESPSLRRFFTILPVLALAAAAGVAQAGEMASDWDIGEKARVRLVAATTAVGTLDNLMLGLEVELEPGWKTYWRSPGDVGIPPQVTWEGSENLGEVDFRWPAPLRFDYYGFDSFGYENRVVYPIEVTPATVGEPVMLRASVDLLVCDDVCIPHSLAVSLDLPSGPSGLSDNAQLINQFSSRVPGDGGGSGLSFESASLSGSAEKPLLEVAFNATEPFVEPDLLVEGSEDVLFSRPEISVDGTRAVFRVQAEDAFDEPGPLNLASLTLTVVDGARSMETSVTPLFGGAVGGQTSAAQAGVVSLLAILALSLIGGLVLNLMPCVLPVLSIKLLSVVSHGGGDPREVRLGFLATTAGIVGSFLLIAGALVGLRMAGLAVGWGIQFQQPIFVIGMVIILTLFAANLWGFFEIRLPGAVADAAVRHSGGTSLSGHFFSGAFATVLATACSAPFLGTAVGFALSRGPVEIFAVFGALGVGMAAPFVLVAAFPKLATKLPKPGNWMITLKKVLSLTLVATAVWLLSVLAAQASLLTAGVVGVLMIIVAAIIALRDRVPASFSRVVPVGVVASALLAFAAPAALPEAEVTNGVEIRANVAWQPFDEAAIGPYVAEGKTVFVDVTADWCITCQVNKKRVLDVGEVAALLQRPDVVAMKADWTKPSDVIAAYLASFGRFGIPFNIIYGPDQPAGVTLPELLTSNAVMTAFATADNNLQLAAN